MAQYRIPSMLTTEGVMAKVIQCKGRTVSLCSHNFYTIINIPVISLGCMKVQVCSYIYVYHSILVVGLVEPFGKGLVETCALTAIV